MSSPASVFFGIRQCLCHIYRIKQVTAAAPCKSSALGALFSTIIALVLLTRMQAGLFPAELEKVLAMIYANCSAVVAGFNFSYVAGLALLP